jgi:hypothetical protein
MIQKRLIIVAMVGVCIVAAYFGVMLSKPIPPATPSGSPSATPAGLPSKATLIPIPSPSFNTTIPTPEHTLATLAPISAAPQTLQPEGTDTPTETPTSNESVSTVAPARVEGPQAPVPPSPPSAPR